MSSGTDLSDVRTFTNILVVDGVGGGPGHYKTVYDATQAAASGDAIQVIVGGTESNACTIAQGVTLIVGGDGRWEYDFNGGLTVSGEMNVSQTVVVKKQFTGNGRIGIDTDGTLVSSAPGAQIGEIGVRGVFTITENIKSISGLGIYDGRVEIQEGKTATVNRLEADGNSTIVGQLNFSGTDSSVEVAESATLTVDSKLVSVFVAVKSLQLDGMLRFKGDTEWNAIRPLYEENDGSNFCFTGKVSGIGKLSIPAGVDFHLWAEDGIEGGLKGSTITVGADARSQFSDINFAVAKNSIVVAANAVIDSVNIRNVTSVNVSSGKTYMDSQRRKVQGWSGFAVKYNLYGQSVLGTQVSFGNFVKAEVCDNLDLKNAARSSLKIGNGSTLTVGDNLTNLKSVAIGNTVRYWAADGTNDGALPTLEIGGDFTPGVQKASMTTGMTAQLQVGGDFRMTGSGNKLACGRNSSTEIGGDLVNVNTLNVAAGMIYSDGKGTKIQGTSSFSVAGDTVTSGALSASFGMNTATSFAGNMTAQKLNLKIGAVSEFEIEGDVAGVNSITVFSAKKATTMAVFYGDVTGTAANDSIKVAANNQFGIGGDLDLVGGKNSLQCDNDVHFRLNGHLDHLVSAKFGKNNRIEASTEALSYLRSMGKACAMGAGSVIADIGTSSVAGHFSSQKEENSDDTIATGPTLSEDMEGWLSNKQAYGPITTYQDLADFFRLENGVDLDDWQLTGEEGTLQVTLYKNNGHKWDTGSVVAESAPGCWDLSTVDIGGATDYRIAVEIASGAGRSVYGYKLETLA